MIDHLFLEAFAFVSWSWNAPLCVATRIKGCHSIFVYARGNTREYKNIKTQKQTESAVVRNSKFSLKLKGMHTRLCVYSLGICLTLPQLYVCLVHYTWYFSSMGKYIRIPERERTWMENTSFAEHLLQQEIRYPLCVWSSALHCHVTANLLSSHSTSFASYFFFMTFSGLWLFIGIWASGLLGFSSSWNFHRNFSLSIFLFSLVPLARLNLVVTLSFAN